jgi:YHS domain-containing protein
MKNICLVMLGLAVFTLVSSGVVFAMSCHDTSDDSKSGHNYAAQDTNSSVKSEIIDVGNKICPVTGEQIDETNKATHEYKGKIYNFCCPKCIKTFKKDPEKYIKKVDETINVGNKICPVLGEKIDEAVKVIYEYEGKIYNFCCAECIESFKKEPQKYIDKVNQELEAVQDTK